AEFDLEFDALTDIARITRDLGQKMRGAPNTGVVIDGNPAFPGIQPDFNLDYSLTDSNAGAVPGVVGSAYSNNNTCVTETTLYDLDRTQGTLVRQSPPNNGTLLTVAALDFALLGPTGFDIGEGSREAIVTTQAAAGGTSVFLMSLTTGHGTLLGSFPAGMLPVTDLALSPPARVCIADVDDGSNTGTKD